MKKIIFIASLLIMIFCTVSYASVDVPETVRIKLNDGSIIELDFDEYLYGVVSSEMGTSYKADGKVMQVGIEALKAQAVASRTYAVYNIEHSKYTDYDLTATTSDQVYKTSNVKDIVKEAVDSTSGQIITYNGEPISAFFFSTSGGHTESPENVWSSALPYLIGVEDTYEPYIVGNSEWEARVPASKYGKIEVLERSVNDRVIKLKVGNEVVTKNNIRTKFGASLVKSTWFDVTYDASTDEYVFKGKGYGHGVGMSQYGAMGMAEEGFDYIDILNWYYTDIEIEPEISMKNDSKDKIKEEDNDKYNKDDEEEINTQEKDYSDAKPTIKDNTKEYGPLLMSILNVINMWG